MALLALDIKKGDEVICPSFSFVSVANAVVKTGARLVFVDIDDETLNMDPARMRDAITGKTKAAIAVHYAGSSCEMDEIVPISKKKGVRVIEDAAQAIGSFYKSRHLGTIGDIGCLSLHGTKNISCGEGGVFLTNDNVIAKKADIIREKGTNRSDFLKGKVDKYHWVSLGSSYVQSDILAAIAIEQLKKVDAITARRGANARYLSDRLAGFYPFIKTQKMAEGASPNWHIYAIMLPGKKERDAFIKGMQKEGVECLTHFVPLHLSSFAVKNLGCKAGDFPVTEKVCDGLVRLPVYPQLKIRDLERIVNAAGRTIKRIRHG